MESVKDENEKYKIKKKWKIYYKEKMERMPKKTIENP